MNEISLRVTIATIVADMKCSTEEYKETCQWLLEWFQEGQNLDKVEEEGSVTHLSTVN